LLAAAVWGRSPKGVTMVAALEAANPANTSRLEKMVISFLRLWTLNCFRMEGDFPQQNSIY
jgi:hypothetical protein